MDLQTRRTLLASSPNPDTGFDYLVLLQGHLAGTTEVRTSISLRYVPDKLIIDAKAFGTYLDALDTMNWDTLEDLAVTVLSDINNELVPRWAQISVNAPDFLHDAVDAHGVVLEERQPKWDNPGLLARLKQI